jgi:hypothetical protein
MTGATAANMSAPGCADRVDGGAGLGVARVAEGLSMGLCGGEGGLRALREPPPSRRGRRTGAAPNSLLFRPYECPGRLVR